MMGPTEPLASGIIAYNGDSERGWNDPPTLSFSSAGGAKKGRKLDLRKRVSHQEALTGQRVVSPVNLSNVNLPGNLTINGHQTKSQGTTNIHSVPPIHEHGTSTQTLPPFCDKVDGFSAQQPHYQMPASNLVGNPNTSTFPPSQIFTPVQQHPYVTHSEARKLNNELSLEQSISACPEPQASSSLGQPLFSFPSSFNMTPISSALDDSLVRSNPIINPETSARNYTTVSGQASELYSSSPVQQTRIFTPLPSSGNSITTSPISNIDKRSPILERAFRNSSKINTPPLVDSGRNSPVLSVEQDSSQVIATTETHSASSSPRCQTPDNACHSDPTSRHSSDQFDSVEALKVTVDAIEEIILMSSSILKTREVDDVKKKVGIMKQLWEEGKLSLPVQMSMKLLIKSLLDGDIETANKLHLKLMVDFVGEVKQWMVAIKRLIAAVSKLNMSGM